MFQSTFSGRLSRWESVQLPDPLETSSDQAARGTDASVFDWTAGTSNSVVAPVLLAGAAKGEPGSHFATMT